MGMEKERERNKRAWACFTCGGNDGFQAEGLELGQEIQTAITVRGPKDAYPPPALKNLGCRYRRGGLIVPAAGREHCVLRKA